MASEGLRRCVFEGCIGTFDSEIQKRQYHKNCGCALHHRPDRPCRGAAKSVSYKIRKAWSESSLVATAAAGSGGGSAGSSPALEKQPFAGSLGEDGKVVWEI